MGRKISSTPKRECHPSCPAEELKSGCREGSAPIFNPFTVRIIARGMQ